MNGPKKSGGKKNSRHVVRNGSVLKDNFMAVAVMVQYVLANMRVHIRVSINVHKRRCEMLFVCFNTWRRRVFFSSLFLSLCCVLKVSNRE